MPVTPARSGLTWEQYDCIYDLADQIQATYKAGHVMGALPKHHGRVLTSRSQPRVGASRFGEALGRAIQEQSPEGRRRAHQDPRHQECAMAATLRILEQEQPQGREEPRLCPSPWRFARSSRRTSSTGATTRAHDQCARCAKAAGATRSASRSSTPTRSTTPSPRPTPSRTLF